MNCRECENIIFEANAAQFVNNQVKNLLEPHLSLCSHCHQLYTDYAKEMEQHFSGRRTQADDWLYAKVADQIKVANHDPVNTRNIFRLGAAFSGAAAAIFLGIFIGNQLIKPISESDYYSQVEVSASMPYASDNLYQDDAFLLILESYLSETEKAAE